MRWIMRLQLCIIQSRSNVCVANNKESRSYAWADGFRLARGSWVCTEGIVQTDYGREGMRLRPPECRPHTLHHRGNVTWIVNQ